MWQSWINFVLGIVLLIMTYAGASTTWFAILSVLIIIFAIWGALGGGKRMAA